jgi:hypothetical protein
MMRFMIQLWSDERTRPDAQRVAAMAKYNETLHEAGVLLSVEGLLASSRGARISFVAGQRTVSHGPFVDAQPLSMGFWIIRADCKAAAIDWAKRCPLGEGDYLEVREVYGPSDFPLALESLATTVLAP